MTEPKLIEKLDFLKRNIELMQFEYDQYKREYGRRQSKDLCKLEDPDYMCQGCNCWKHTRAMCS